MSETTMGRLHKMLQKTSTGIMSNFYTENYLTPWLEQSTKGLPSENIVCLFGENLKSLCKRASSALSKITLMTIFKSVSLKCAIQYPLLKDLKIELSGISFDQFSDQFNKADPTELKEAFNYLIKELTAKLSSLTGGGVPDKIRDHDLSKIESVANVRMESLFEMSKAFLAFGNLEIFFIDVFLILEKTISFQSILLLEKKGSQNMKTSIWITGDKTNEEISKALDYSRSLYEYLVSSYSKEAQGIAETAEPISKYHLSLRSQNKLQNKIINSGRFITMPLTLSNLVPFGILQFEINSLINESDLMFLSVVSNLLAAALDRSMKEDVSNQLKQQDIDQKIRELELLKENVKELENERDLRDQFVSILTHDLRTPLTSAKLAAQLILRKPENVTKIKVSAGQIVKSIDRTDQMIKDLLDVNKIRAGVPLTFVMNECDLRQIALHTLRDLGITYGDRFILETDNEMIKGYWNEEAIRRVLENLATNAVKYGYPQKHIIVSLKQSGSNVEFSVHNEGVPISLYDQINLFKPFQRTNSALNGHNKGWGLGLTLVRGVAEAHGGYVKVKSNETDGTNFVVTMPRDCRPFQMLNL